MTKSFFAFALGFAAAALASTASAQDRPLASGSTGGAAVQGPGSPQGGTLQGTAPRGGPAPAGLNREQMWFAPIAEDWKKPCLITWQRTWEDAQAVSKSTGKPLLVCVNMDGEIASEHYAGVRYRQPEVAKLYEPYVCVIASVYRHNPRDWDEQGRRLLCPRFGSVTCGEHIAIEPKLYGQFFDGQRVAPRHIGVEQDGKEMYDVFYAWDTDTIFNSLKKGVENRPAGPELPRGDRTLDERLVSRDITDRDAIELAYQQGDRTLRRRLIETSSVNCDGLQVEVLRLAIRGFDVELAKAARAVLARCASEETLDLIVDALRMPMEASERDALIAALTRVGETSQRARMLASVHQGLATRSSALDTDVWTKALSDTSAAAGVVVERAEIDARLARSAEVAIKAPDPAAKLEFAQASLELALDVQSARTYGDAADARRFTPLMLQDARKAALDAETHGLRGWSVDSTAALAAYYLGDRDEAAKRAEAAMGDVPVDPQSWNSMAVIAIFADARQRAIEKAVREKSAWPAQWLADAHAAFGLLARHPHGNDQQIANQFDFLLRLGAWPQASRALDVGLARFPESALLHERLRRRTLDEKGLEGLESVYDGMLAAPNASPSLEWFAGYASFVTAEFHKRGGRADESLAAYGRAIAHYERMAASKPDTRANCDHYVALALAGRARIALEREDFDGAVEQMVASFTRKPEAAATLDGLNLSPVDTAKVMLVTLKAKQLDTLVAKVENAMSKLDPELLKLPAYERGESIPEASGERPPRGRRGE